MHRLETELDIKVASDDEVSSRFSEEVFSDLLNKARPEDIAGMKEGSTRKDDALPGLVIDKIKGEGVEAEKVTDFSQEPKGLVPNVENPAAKKVPARDEAASGKAAEAEKGGKEAEKVNDWLKEPKGNIKNKVNPAQLPAIELADPLVVV